MIRAVIDTNVILSALRSSLGASHQILLAAGREEFQMVLSIPLLVEYEDVLSRPESGVVVPESAVDAVLSRLAAVAHQQKIHYLWRPHLRDPGDDMVFEAAFASGATHIVTYNIRDLRPASEFGISVIRPADFLKLLLRPS